MSEAFDITILIPTKDRPAALAVTLGGLLSQTARGFSAVISDQSEGIPSTACPEVETVIRALELHGHPVRHSVHLPRRGMAEQRAFLLSQVTTRFALFLDDDLLLERGVVERMRAAILAEGCGFVGCAPIGLSYQHDVRPNEQRLELWRGPVEPECITPDTRAWDRHSLHNAANLLHAQAAFGRFAEGEYLAYKVAWVGGCVLFDTHALREVGGFDFWDELPDEHAGEDVVAQLRVMERFGGCGILPSGVYHLELPTTIPRRETDAPRVLTATPCSSPR
jgi:hypothetical protein